MDKPKLTDYATLIFTLFEQFEQAERGGTAKVGKPYTFSQKCFIVLFVILQFRHIFEFKAQKRWLEEHPDMFSLLKWPRVPHRTTFSRRYKALGSLLAAFITFVGGAGVDLGDEFANYHLVEDKSLFKAQGPVWHQSDRKAGRIPDKLRHLDTDATWGKSAYQGWVYGYGLHITCTEAAFPKLVPGKELGMWRQPGHRFFYSLEEVELIRDDA